GRTPLIYAAKCSTVLAVVSTLLKAGADVNARDCYGMSPLLYAAWLGQNPAIASALLSAGADPMARGMSGHTLMEYAENNPAIVKEATVLQQLQEAMKGTRASAQRIHLHG